MATKPKGKSTRSTAKPKPRSAAAKQAKPAQTKRTAKSAAKAPTTSANTTRKTASKPIKTYTGTMPSESRLPLMDGLKNMSLKRWAILCASGGIVLLLFSGGLWFSKLYNTPETVFWRMFDNNLSTRGVTRHVTEKNQGGNVDQFAQVTFGAEPSAQTLTKLTQQSPDGSGAGGSAVTTELISVPDADYVHYVSVNSGQKDTSGKDIDFTSVTKDWAKMDMKNKTNPSLQEALFGLVPVGYMSKPERTAMINAIKKSGAYDVNFKTVTSKSEHGRTLYVYKATLKVQPFIAMLKNHMSDRGYGANDQLDPNSYSPDQTTEVTITVDKFSHQLTQVEYSGRTEVYQGFGAVFMPKLPSNTISPQELQQRLQGASQS